jgi:hypothetical protein
MKSIKKKNDDEKRAIHVTPRRLIRFTSKLQGR